MLTRDQNPHLDALTALLGGTLTPLNVPTYVSGEVPRDQAGLPLAPRFVELSMEARATEPESVRKCGYSSRRPWSLSVTSVATTYREVARIQSLVSSALTGARVTVDSVPSTPISLDFGDTPDRTATGIWMAIDGWIYTH